MTETTTTAERAPFRSPLKWAGGKTRSASVLAALAPPSGFERFIEPFCGSAAVFFALRPREAILADAIRDLAITFRIIRDEPEALMAKLDEMPNNRRHFNKTRAQAPETLDDLHRAVRTVYLNKTAFRGLWRVNRQGRFNTPYGDYDRPYYNRQTLLAASAALEGIQIKHADFRETLAGTKRGDWLFLDPPYVPDREWGDFKRYTAGQFGPEDHAELAMMLRELDRGGVRWLHTNSDTPLVRELYDGWNIGVLPTRRDIALTAKDRASVDLVVSNYEPKPHDAVLPLSEWDKA